MALLNNTCTYAIRAALHVAASRPAPGAFVSTRKIADDLAVPFAFLTKVLQGLTQSGILVSQRGASGGVALARPAEDIALHDILEAVGGEAVFRECVLGLPTCSDATPCALHQPWRQQRTVLENLFTRTTLADLVADGAATLPSQRSEPAGEPTAAVARRGRAPDPRRLP